MDKNVSAVIEKQIMRTIKALQKNRFEAHYIPTWDDLLAKLGELMPKGCSCSVGGSVTLDETGVLGYLKNGGFTYYDRYAPGADLDKVFHDALNCDVYFCGANAITMDGRLYNVDGRGNRVAAIVYGPKKVVVIAGYNKIVENLDDAIKRNRNMAAPANALRLDKKTPCAETGLCQDCSCPDRICSQELITGWQFYPGRICVLILGKEYGF